jgi:iron complex outermembrane receptor protein
VGVNVPAGVLTIQGWEMDATAVLTNNFDLIGGAGNLDSKTSTGFEARSVPFGTNYRAFLKYTIHTGPLGGFFAGFGLQHDGPRAADAADDANLPQYTVCNALIGYALNKHWRIQCNVNNVFNTVYESISVARTIIYAGNPTDASGTLTYSF